MLSIEVDKINFSYQLHKNEKVTFKLEDISFSLNKGTFLSILGPNGSGKSTLLKIIDKILHPISGNITILGKDFNKISKKELSRYIAFVPQSTPPNFPYTVYETVLMGRAPYLGGIGFENEKDRDVAIRSMEKTDIINLANRNIQNLSGGEIQRVYLARALTQQAPILLLDEPNTHLDLTHQIDILTLIKKLTIENKFTVISVFHDINLASLFSDMILILHEGRVFEFGKPEYVLNEKNLKTVFGTETIIDKHPIKGIPRVTLNPN
ncbi:MAG: Vitamin B12 ABC transporter, ATPase component BtuD [Ignavibacteriae bacterium]|nr:MAG: Vitamin B12 ABC transporter, ATPase component BtuD [Ignavibacteriota bacterium]